MTNLYLWARKIHRFLAIATALLMTIMAVTGTMLKYTKIADILPFIDLGYVRFIHSAMAPLAGITIMFMAMTGIVLYLAPILLRRPKSTPPPDVVTTGQNGSEPK